MIYGFHYITGRGAHYRTQYNFNLGLRAEPFDRIMLNAFIDYRKYKNLRELGDYLDSITEREYQHYISAMTEFLNSDRFYPFTSKAFANNISDCLV